MSQAYWHTVSLYLQGGCWRDGHRTEDPHKSQPFDMYIKAVSKVVFDKLSPFIVCRIETLWYYYGNYYSKDIFMTCTILLIFYVVCYETMWTILFRLGRYEPSQFHVFVEHRGSVNVKLGIVQVKLRFHGGTRGKERVKELVSQVTERVLLVLCFWLRF